MSNEKPVRITVGDVKEVVEATTINAETWVPNKPVAVATHVASAPDSSGMGMVYGAGLIGLVLFFLASYFGLSGKPTIATPASIGNSKGMPNMTKPAATTPTVTDTNVPAPTTPGGAAAGSVSPDANNATK